MYQKEEFCQYLQKTKGSSKATVTAYISDMNDYEAFLQTRGKEPAESGSADLASYLMKLKADGKNPATIARKLSTIRIYFGFLHEKGEIAENPANGIKPPKAVEKNVEYLSLEDVTKLLDIPVQNPIELRDKALLELMYATGMRAGEISAVKVRDVDLMIGFVLVRSGAGRMIPIGKPALKVLKRYLQEGRPALTGGKEDCDTLFVNYHGKQLSRQSIWKMTGSYGVRAGIETEVTPQVLRNSFAVHMVQNGADLRSIQELMGLDCINAARVYFSTVRNRIMDVYDRTHPRALDGDIL